MKFETISELVKGVPFIDPQNARYLYDLIIRERLSHILELGIAHGTGTCYMAAAVEELGGGAITSVDLSETKLEFRPSPEEQLAKANLSRFVNIVRMQTGYNWFLHDEIRRRTNGSGCTPEYDLCIIDGSKNWTIDGCAFFLADKLLKDNGWIIFDDYHWTYADADNRREVTDGITHRSLSEDERVVPHVKEIFELLVTQHPSYSRFYRTGNWAIAQKTASGEKTYTIVHRENFASIFGRVLAAVKHRAKHPAAPAQSAP